MNPGALVRSHGDTRQVVFRPKVTRYCRAWIYLDLLLGKSEARIIQILSQSGLLEAIAVKPNALFRVAALRPAIKSI